MNPDAAKRAAAEAAVALVETGMVLGLGTGSTMAFAIDAIARRIRDEGLRVRGVPTSDWAATRAASLGIPLSDLAADPSPDLAIDGADEVEDGTLRLIKGLGGALLREKIVAEASHRFVVVADPSKLVDRLGRRSPLPVEITPFGQAATARRITALGLMPTLRTRPDGTPFITDNANHILDCAGVADVLEDAAELEDMLRAIAGVVGTGLFLAGVERAIIGQADGTTRTLSPANHDV